MLDVLTSYTCPSDVFPLAGLGIRLNDLEARHGLTAQSWHVYGLGTAQGFAFRAASGRVYLLEELESSIEHQHSRGPEVYVDAGDMATIGPEALIKEVIATLGLCRSDVAYLGNESAKQSAARLMDRIARTRGNRQSQADESLGRGR
jgi:hypothetical protein